MFLMHKPTRTKVLMQLHRAGVPKGFDTHLANRCFIITVNEARTVLSDRSHA